MEERRVAPGALGVDRGAGIHVSPTLDQPARHVDVVELQREVQKRAAGDGRRVLAMTGDRQTLGPWPTTVARAAFTSLVSASARAISRRTR